MVIKVHYVLVEYAFLLCLLIIIYGYKMHNSLNAH